jgi:hypothetical protein
MDFYQQKEQENMEQTVLKTQQIALKVKYLIF